MSLLHLIKEEQLDLFGFESPNRLQDEILSILDDMQSEIDLFKNIKTIEEVESLWHRIEDIIWEEAFENVDTPWEDNIYMCYDIVEHLVERKPDVFGELSLEDMQGLYFYWNDEFDIDRDDIDEEFFMEIFLPSLNPFPAIDNIKVLDSVYIIYDALYHIDEVRDTFLEAYKKEKEDSSYDDGIDTMFFYMKDDAETINGVDHIYAEREIKFSYEEYREIFQSYNSLGIYWSWAEGYGEAYGGRGDVRVLYKALIPVSSVNWEATFMKNVYDLKYEKELEVYEGVNIKLTEVHLQLDNYKNDFYNAITSIASTYFPTKSNDFMQSGNLKRDLVKYFRDKEDTLLPKITGDYTFEIEHDKYYIA